MSVHNGFSLLLFSSLIVLSACGAGKPTDDTQSSKLLNTTDAPMDLVEEETQPNPVQQHAAARKQVNPLAHDSRKYTSKGNAAAQDQPVHFRVLKLERQMSDLRDDFGRLLKPLSKIPTGDNELKDTVGQIEMQQQKAAAEHMAMYGQPAEPMPGHATQEEEAQSASLKDEKKQGAPLDVAPPPLPVKPKAKVEEKTEQKTMARVDELSQKVEELEKAEPPSLDEPTARNVARCVLCLI
jgi:hypothetical protein